LASNCVMFSETCLSPVKTLAMVFAHPLCARTRRTASFELQRTARRRLWNCPAAF
jgi:hypothetical protein